MADSLDETALLALPAAGTELVLCREGTVLHTQPDLSVTELFESGEIRYTARVWK